MSTSDLYILNKKSVTHFAKFRNGWGSGPVVWRHIGEKYVSDKPQYWEMDRRTLERIWALAGDRTLEIDERIALMMTFDHSFVPLKNLKEAGEACITFHRRVRDTGSVNHWADIGEALIRLSKTKKSRHAQGAVLSCTSVGDVWLEADAARISKAWPIFAEICS